MCSMLNCNRDALLGGLCKDHHDESEQRRLRREAALRALHAGVVDGKQIEDATLRDEFFRIRVWWFDVCRSIQNSRDVGHIPLDEAPYAVEWCISLVQEIIDADGAIRIGKRVSDKLEGTRFWVWGRFENLQKGLHSNGTPREP